MGNIYSGSIEVERRLTANMPSKLPGNRWVVSKDANDSEECYLHIVDQKGDLLPVKDKATATLVNNIINSIGSTIPIEEKGSLSLLNGWTNYGNGRSNFGYVKHGNRVFLSGVIKGGSNNIFATLPSNLIPSKAQILYCHSTSNSNINSTRFDVWTNGDVSISVYDTTNSISLDGVSYTI